jgi:hypothetical protein
MLPGAERLCAPREEGWSNFRPALMARNFAFYERINTEDGRASVARRERGVAPPRL